MTELVCLLTCIYLLKFKNPYIFKIKKKEEVKEEERIVIFFENLAKNHNHRTSEKKS